MRSVFSLLTVGALAWGVLTFGAVYPWAYRPLLVALAGLGTWGAFAPAGSSTRRVNRNLAIGLALLASAVALQLVPVPRDTLLAISPSADSLLRHYDLAYASSSTEGGVVARHALSIQPQQTWLGLLCLVCLGVFLLGLTRALTTARVSALGSGLIVVGLVVAMIAVVQRPFFGGRIYGIWIPAAGLLPFGPAGGPFGPFVNRNHFAGWMLMALPLAIGHLCGMVAGGSKTANAGWRARLVRLSTRDASHVVFAGSAILVMSLALALTLSRSGLICLIVALLVSALVVSRRGAGRSRKVLVLGSLMALVIFTISWTGVDAIAGRFERLGSDADGRFLPWQDAWRVTTAFPWTGTGLNTYGTAMLFYQTFQAGQIHYAQAHNDYLQLLAEGGMLLAVPAGILFVLFVREVWRRFAERADDVHAYWIRCGAVTGVVAIALQEIVDFSLQIPGNAAMFVLLCGIAARKSGGHARASQRS